MSQKRMFSLQIVDTDVFLEMPLTSQLLYFHLAMRADDEGFVGSPKKIIKMCGFGDDDLKVLLAKRFILTFESGVVVIKHWLIHNTIRMDRLNPTTYQEEKKMLEIKGNKAYTEAMSTTCQPLVNHLAPQVKLSKVKLSKVRSATKVASLPQKKKDPNEPMNLTEFVGWCKQSPQRHICIIGEWAETVRPDLQTYGQWKTYIKRHLRAAMDLVPFSQDQLDIGYQKMMGEKDWLKRYTLETLTKFLT